MTDTTVAIAPLTADDIAALRAADSVSFYHTPKDGGYVIAWVERHADTPIFTAREQRLFPIVDSIDRGRRSRRIGAVTRMGGYGGDNGMSYWALANDDARAIAYASVDGNMEEWQTIRSLLRPGDTLTLHWVASSNNIYVRDAGLHRDRLSLAVNGAPGRFMLFHVASSVTPDNTSRMVRRFG